MIPRQPQVLVVGAGSAGLVAALSAVDLGAAVTLLDAAGPSDLGGNARLSGGLFLFAHEGLRDVAALLEPGVRDGLDVEPLPVADYRGVLRQMADGRVDDVLADVLVQDSLTAMRWLAAHGVRFTLPATVFGPHMRNGRTIVPAGPAGEALGGGPGLVSSLITALIGRGVDVQVRAEVADLIVRADRVTGVVTTDGRSWEADAVILASGGFEASSDLRRRHLGPEWERVTVRGTRYNTGAPLAAALRAGAQPWGDFAACHAISVDARAPALTPAGGATAARLSRGFRFGIVVNAHGARFCDEGEDTWTRIYSKMGRAILRQPGAVAFHVFDAAMTEQVRAAIPDVVPIEGATLDEAAARAGIDPAGLTRTVAEFNAAVGDGLLDLDRLDGRATIGISPPKSNWATAIERPPFLIYPAACGVTFTHGGVRIDADGRVLGSGGVAMPGLYAAGEITGGLFFDNYPGGSSLMRSTVFGLRAAAAAAADVPSC